MVGASLDQEDVNESLSFIEQMLSNLSSDDEYLAAILHNQKIMTQALAGGDTPMTGQGSNIPPGTAGLALASISEDDVGDILFKIDGRTVISDLRAGTEISADEVVRVGDDGDEVYPISDVSSGKLDFGAVATANVGPSSFVFAETEDNITISPGETKAVLDIDVNGPIGWYQTGTNDATYSEYQYAIDGEPLVETPLKKPLGLYNNMYDFPAPLEVGNNLQVLVSRQDDAPGDEEYFSNVALIR